MVIVESYKRFLKNYANFNGRSTRADYWYVVLANFIIGFVLGFIAGLVPELSFLSSIYSLATLVPGLAIAIRRLHDINKSGWNYCLVFIPIVGAILLLINLCKPSVDENNQYGVRV